MNENNGVSEPPIKLVHVLNPGEREYLSANLIGLQNIAMTFLPKSLNFINVIDAYREIVNGVRYEIILNAEEDQLDAKDGKNKTELVCRLVILEKPWIRTDWGDKYRELQHSNCTRDDNIEDSDTAASNFVERRSEIANNVQHYNAVTRNELDTAEMRKLEAQIIAAEVLTTTETPATIVESVDMTTIQPQSSSSSSSSIELEAITVTMPTPELNDNEMKWLDDFLAVGALNFEQMLREQQQQQHPVQSEFNNYPNGEEQTDVEQVSNY